jgi:cytosine/adenosine deaminase-related metal-dependent hydrolase
MTKRFENGIVVTLGSKIASFGTVGCDRRRNIGSWQRREMSVPKASNCAGKIVLPGFICTHHHFY